MHFCKILECSWKAERLLLEERLCFTKLFMMNERWILGRSYGCDYEYISRDLCLVINSLLTRMLLILRRKWTITFLTCMMLSNGSLKCNISRKRSSWTYHSDRPVTPVVVTTLRNEKCFAATHNVSQNDRSSRSMAKATTEWSSAWFTLLIGMLGLCVLTFLRLFRGMLNVQL